MSVLIQFAQHCCTVLTFCVKVSYPTYASFKAIKSDGDDDDTTWLIYWVIFGVLSFAEIYLIPFVQWVPFFMLARLCVYIWLQMPVMNGSIYLFQKIVKPFFNENQAIFEKITIEDSGDLTNTIIDAKKSLGAVYEEIYSSL